MAKKQNEHESAGHDPGKGSGPKFEEALGQVEEIIQRIEAGRLGLEEQIAEYERGVRLLRQCREILTRCEQRVQEIDAELGELDEGARRDSRPQP